MVPGQGRELLAGLVAGLLFAAACSDDTAAPASSSTTSTTTVTSTAAPTADGVTVTPAGQVRWEYDLVIWLDADASDEELSVIADAVAADPAVQRAEFFDQDAALVEFERIFADDPQVIEEVTADVLPLSWRVRLVDCGNPEAAEEVANTYERRPGVRAVVTASVAVVVAC